jgi:hypothetical protein
VRSRLSFGYYYKDKERRDRRPVIYGRQTRNGLSLLSSIHSATVQTTQQKLINLIMRCGSIAKIQDDAWCPRWAILRMPACTPDAERRTLQSKAKEGVLCWIHDRLVSLLRSQCRRSATLPCTFRKSIFNYTTPTLQYSAPRSKLRTDKGAVVISSAVRRFATGSHLRPLGIGDDHAVCSRISRRK